jgi:hypothetical protein
LCVSEERFVTSGQATAVVQITTPIQWLAKGHCRRLVGGNVTRSRALGGITLFHFGHLPLEGCNLGLVIRQLPAQADPLLVGESAGPRPNLAAEGA